MTWIHFAMKNHNFWKTETWEKAKFIRNPMSMTVFWGEGSWNKIYNLPQLDGIWGGETSFLV